MSDFSLSLSGHWITFVVDILVLIYLIYTLFYKKNWRFIGINRVGVIFRLGKAIMAEEETELGEEPKALLVGPGIYHLHAPVDRLVVVAMFDIRIRIVLTVPTAAPNPQNFKIRVIVVVKCQDPLKSVMAVPDGNPVGEFRSAIEGAIYSGVQSFSTDDIMANGAKDRLEATIFQKIQAHPLAERWGLVVPQVIVKDIDPSKDFMAAVGKTLQAEYEARAYRTKKDEMGSDLVVLSAIEALQKSKITTLVGLGDTLKKFLEGGTP